MQIEALNSACVDKQKVLSSAAKETTGVANTNTETTTNSSSSSSSGYDWLDEAYQFVFGGKSGSGALSDVNWNKWSRTSSSSASKSKLAFGSSVDFSNVKNLSFTSGDTTSTFDELPEGAFSSSYEDFQVAIYSIF